jgi:hypothetical protein
MLPARIWHYRSEGDASPLAVDEGAYTDVGHMLGVAMSYVYNRKLLYGEYISMSHLDGTIIGNIVLEQVNPEDADSTVYYSISLPTRSPEEVAEEKYAQAQRYVKFMGSRWEHD